MARSKKADQLRNVGLFSACTDRELAQIARACDEVSVDPSVSVVVQGTVGEDFFLIVTGEAEVVRNGQAVATVGPGQYFGELSLLDEAPRNATVRARTPMSLITLGRREFSAVLDSWPGVAHKLLQTMARRLRDADHNAIN